MIVAKPFRKLSSLVHFLHGFLAGFITWINLPLSLFLYLQFFLYEWVEERKLQDEMYSELKEWSFGFVAGFIIYLVLMLNGIRIC